MSNFADSLIDPFYRKWNMLQTPNIEEWYKDLQSQFELDCSPEDLKYNKEAKRCYNMIKRKKKQVKKIVKKYGRLLTQ